MTKKHTSKKLEMSTVGKKMGKESGSHTRQRWMEKSGSLTVKKSVLILPLTVAPFISSNLNTEHLSNTT